MCQQRLGGCQPDSKNCILMHECMLEYKDSDLPFLPCILCAFLYTAVCGGLCFAAMFLWIADSGCETRLLLASWHNVSHIQSLCLPLSQGRLIIKMVTPVMLLSVLSTLFVSVGERIKKCYPFEKTICFIQLKNVKSTL